MHSANSLLSKALACANLMKNAIYAQSIRLKSTTKLVNQILSFQFCNVITFLHLKFGGDDRRRHGYNIRLHQGLLPRNPDESRMLPMPEYRPRDVWAPKRALFGQVNLIRNPLVAALNFCISTRMTTLTSLALNTFTQCLYIITSPFMLEG